MLRVIEHHHASSWPADSAADSLTLDFDNRHRRRIRLTTDSGAHVLLDLPKAVAMAHGDGLKLEDGSWLRINAAPEALVEIHASDATLLAKIAWHIGNRHFPAQILRGAIRIRPDHVIEAMIAGLGGWMTRLDAPFQPEGGAYGGQPMHGQAHGHSHVHDHSHGHDASHGHHHDEPRGNASPDGRSGHSHDHEHGHGTPGHHHRHPHEH
jgi:urease accessory protein